jgi:mono/diheme cytochrome c family protein
MNTSKQVNVIIGLLMVGAIATLLYFLWDVLEREQSANDRQLMESAERGGALFALNCSSCHGLTGKGALERGGLPGAVLNDEGFRATTSKDLDPLRDRFRDTITCGRVGTLMPAWSDAQGGSLNTFQIDQLVALITGTMREFDAEDNPDPNGISEEAWAHAVEEANHSAEFDPPKALVAAIGPDDTELVLNKPLGMSAGDVIRIDDEPTEEGYELVTVVDAPASSILSASVGADDAELPVQLGYVFRAGDILTIEKEKVKVSAAPASTELTAAAGTDDTILSVADAAGFADDEIIRVGGERMRIVSVSGDALRVERGVEETKVAEHEAESPVIDMGKTITVERGVEGTTAAKHRTKREVEEVGDIIKVERGALKTEAAEHEGGAEVFQGPIPPPDSVTSETCGQKAAETAEEPAAETVEVSGSAAIELGDNFFDVAGKRNPTLAVKAGAVSIQLTSVGTAIHNMVIAGPDGEFGTDDDAVSDPAAISGGGTGALSFTGTEAATLLYQCDFHPDDMKGEITITQ